MPRSPHLVDAQVGARIAARRRAMGLSQSVLGERIGISPQQVQKYEAGANRTSASRLNQIAQALGVTPGAFFPNIGDGPGSPDQSFDVGLCFMMATTEGRSIVANFPLIKDRAVRQAIAALVAALSPQ